MRGLFRSREGTVLLALVLLCGALHALTGGRFLRAVTLSELARQTGPHLVLTLGQALVILTGGIDLSVAAVAALCSMVLATTLERGWPFGLALGAVLACAVAVGALHTLLVARVRVPAFIATLGTFCMARSLSEVLHSGTPLTLPDHAGLEPLYNDDLLGVPMPLCVALVLLAVSIVLTRTTIWGRRLHAVGGNEQASFLAGVPLFRTHLVAYVACALCAALAALIWTAKVSQGDPGMARGYELYAVAGAVIGGVSLKGGRGSMLGVALGTLVLQILVQAQIHLQDWVPTYWRDFLLGFVLVAAVVADALWRERPGPS